MQGAGTTIDALANSRNIKYIFTQQDSLLKFDERFYPKNDELWHDEDVISHFETTLER